MPDAGIDRLSKLGLALVVAVEVDIPRLHAGGAGDCQLAAGHDVEPEPLGCDDGGQRPEEPRLRGVEDARVGVPRTELLEEGAALSAQRLFVEDVQRRTEVLRESDAIAAADAEATAGGDL